jgi:glutamate dehydrogenase (NAD(P)+)
MNGDLTFDYVGPQRIYHYYAPESRMRAVVVIDTKQFPHAGGGLRMLPDVSVGEVALLARAMTYKFAWLDLNIAGGKGGIWFDPVTQDRDAVLAAFGREAAPLLQSREFMFGVDMGTSTEDMDTIRAAAGMPPESGGLAARRRDGLTMEELVTGYGVVKATGKALEIAGRSLDGATIALEGLGKVGTGCVRQAAAEGARIVAVSTLAGTRHDANGLDVGRLLALREECGDECVVRYDGGELLPKEALYSVKADVLIPGARTHCITAGVAGSVRASLIIPAANAPVTPEADEILYERGVTVVPDFVANSGGVLLAVVGSMGGDEEAAFSTTGERISENVGKALDEAKARNVSPQTAAIAVAHEWLARKRAEREG